MNGKWSAWTGKASESIAWLMYWGTALGETSQWRRDPSIPRRMEANWLRLWMRKRRSWTSWRLPPKTIEKSIDPMICWRRFWDFKTKPTRFAAKWGRTWARLESVINDDFLTVRFCFFGCEANCFSENRCSSNYLMKCLDVNERSRFSVPSSALDVSTLIRHAFAPRLSQKNVASKIRCTKKCPFGVTELIVVLSPHVTVIADRARRHYWRVKLLLIKFQEK